jgi:hypothetical protein
MTAVGAYITTLQGVDFIIPCRRTFPRGVEGVSAFEGTTGGLRHNLGERQSGHSQVGKREGQDGGAHHHD